MRHFFEDTATGWTIVKWTGICLLIHVVWNGCAQLIIDALHLTLSKQEGDGALSLYQFDTYVIVLVFVVREELIFRTIPLAIIGSLVGPELLPRAIVIVINSALFGWIHGGFDHIALQGVGGLLYSALYLKCGGFNGFRWNALSAFLACVAAHYAFNLVVAVFFLSRGITAF